MTEQSVSQEKLMTETLFFILGSPVYLLGDHPGKATLIRSNYHCNDHKACQQK